VLQAAGIPEAVLSIDEVSVELVQAKARELLAKKADLSIQMQVAQIALREVSSRTSAAVADEVRRSTKRR
jgi:hypothetical protein